MPNSSFDWRGLKLSLGGSAVAIVGMGLVVFLSWLPALLLVAVGFVLAWTGGFMHVRAMRRDALEWMKTRQPAQGAIEPDRNK